MAASKNGTKNGTQKAEDNGVVKGDSAEKQESVAVGTNVGKNSTTQESVYTVDEFCSNAQNLFNTMPECVRAALTEKGINQCKKVEAEKIVKAFIEKEIK